MFSLRGPYILIFPQFGHIFGTFPPFFSGAQNEASQAWRRFLSTVLGGGRSDMGMDENL